MTPRVVVFDVLGTVLDERGSFRAAVEEAQGPGPESVAAADRWLDEVSREVSRIASRQAPFRPWDALVAEALGRQDLGGHRERLTAVGHRLHAWEDSAAGLASVRARSHVVAMSNAGLEPLMDSSRHADLTWSAVLSSEMIRAAKPDPRVYAFLLDVLGVEPAEVLFVAAHPWDLRAAAEHGMRTAFVRRPGEGEAARDDVFDWIGTTLPDLAAAMTSW